MYAMGGSHGTAINVLDARDEFMQPGRAKSATDVLQG
jgi:hypothetical protein